MVRVLFDDTAYAPVVSEVLAVVTQKQCDAGATIRLVLRLDGEFRLAVRLPQDTLISGVPALRVCTATRSATINDE